MSRILVTPQFNTQEDQHLVVAHLNGAAEGQMGHADVYTLSEDDSKLYINIMMGPSNSPSAKELPLSEPIVIFVEKCPRLRSAEVIITDTDGAVVSQEPLNLTPEGGSTPSEDLQSFFQAENQQFRFTSCQNIPSPVHHGIRSRSGN